MSAFEAGTDARVLMFSPRKIEQFPWLTLQYEFEDIVAEVDSVDIIAPARTRLSYARQLEHAVSNKTRQFLRRPIRQPIGDVKIRGEYDLFFAAVYFGADLAYLSHLRGWRERCRKAVCFLAEVWTPQLSSKREYLHLLEQFDHVFVMSGPVCEPLSRLIDRPVSYMPHGTNTELFTPGRVPPARSIDFCSLGRRTAGTHAALMTWAQRTSAFYLYDTMTGGTVLDHREHRRLVADYIKRSRYFLAYSINPARLSRTGGDEALSTRYFEGAAGGAVMVGTTPKCPEWEQSFDWPDAVIEIPYETTKIADILADLDSQPERLALARYNNVVNSLQRHDWSHRWRTILGAAGMEPLQALHDRLATLESHVAAVPPPSADAGTMGPLVLHSPRSAKGGAA